MKKILSVLMATLMFLTLLMPLSVFAENGPYPTDWENITDAEIEDLENISLIYVVNYATGEMGYAYPTELTEIYPVGEKISYDKETNTLTLKNYCSDVSALFIVSMGDDFKIELVGYNEIGTISTVSTDWGCSVTLVGDGALVVNKSLVFSEALSLDYTDAEKGFFKASNSVALKLCGVGEQEYSTSYPSVVITQATNADFSKVLILEGNVKENITVKSQKFDINVYEQEEAYCLYDIALGNLYYFRKDGDTETLYAGERIYEGGYTTDYYNLYLIEFDEIFDLYLVKKMDGYERVKPTELGYVEADSNDEIFDLMRQSNLALWPASRRMLNVAYTEDGTKCVFDEYIDKSNSDMYRTITQSYPLVEHPVYGKVALTYTYFRGGQPNIKEKTLIDTREVYDYKSFTSTITMNNEAFVVPSKVVLKKAVNSVNGVKVTWEAQETAETYIIYRKVSGAKSFKKIGTSTTNSYVDKTAKSGVKYEYTVKAKNIAGTGSCQKPGVSVTYLATPKATISNTSSGIKIKWNKVDSAANYAVYRSQYTDGKWTKWKKVNTAKKDSTSYTDKKAESGVKYKYTVKAINGKVKSSIKSTDSLVRLKTTTLKVAARANGIKLSWSKVAGATQYKLYRSELQNGKWSSWSTLTKVEAANTTYVDNTVKPGVTYKYSVKAVNGSSLGARASSDKLLYLNSPDTSIVNGETGIVVNWSKVDYAEKYIIYRSEEKNGKWTSWKKVKTVKSTTEYWVDESVVVDAKYKYIVKAQNGDYKSYYKVSNKLVYIKTRYVF